MPTARKRLYCYVDESGQDTAGYERDAPLSQLLEIERQVRSGILNGIKLITVTVWRTLIC
jgi:hypothetical protein